MFDQSILEKYIKAKENLEKKILNLTGVHGISVGFKTTGGSRTEELAIVVHVYKKVDAKNLSKENNINELVSSYDVSIASDVVERPLPIEEYLVVSKLQVDAVPDTAKYRPLKGGCRLAVEDATSYYYGTGGCIAVSGRSDSTKSILTNYHVVKSSQDNFVYQPSVNSTDKIGDVGNTAYTELVDGAEVTLGSSINSENKIIDIGSVKGTKAPALNDLVEKRGYVTGLTHGKITNVAYSGTSSGGRKFKNQVIVSKINSGDPALSGSGDSGSAWVFESEVKVTGLHWGGDGVGNEAYASPIGDVEAALGVTVATE